MRPTGDLIVDTLRVEAVLPGGTESLRLTALPTRQCGAGRDRSKPGRRGRRMADPGATTARGWRRGSRRTGPVLIVDPVSHDLCRAGLAGAGDDDGTLILTRAGERRGRSGRRPIAIRSGWRSSPGCSWRSPRKWARRCGARAASVNIRERLDFSCALFDAGGNLIANAPHIPVHLGSMGESIRTVIDRARRARCGRARSMRSTIPIAAARTCPTSRWSCRYLPTRAPRPPSSSRRAGTMPMSAASRPGSMPSDSVDARARKAWCSTMC